jgi:hypothetical protein
MKVTSSLKQFLFLFFKNSFKNFGVVWFVSSPRVQETRSEGYDILVLKSIGCSKPHIVVMLASKTMVQLRFGIHISP